jgi:uncharacterized protein
MEMANLIIDAHVHTYPTAAVGQSALQGTGRTKDSGTLEELLPLMDKGGISYTCQANMTPTFDMKMAAVKNLPPGSVKGEAEINAGVVDRMKRRNAWTCRVAQENKRLIPLISVDILQSAEEMIAEIDEKFKMGAKGLKLHPMANRVFPYDRRLWPAYARARDLNLPVLFHSGKAEIIGMADKEYAQPKNFEPVLEGFPGLKIILAHLGKGFLDETVEIGRKYKNVYFDTCAIFPGFALDPHFRSGAEAADFLRTVGVQKIFFGSDWPWLDPLLCIEQIKGLGLNEEEMRGILGENAAKVFAIDAAG